MRYFLTLTTLLLLTVLPGCGQSNERNHPLFRKGEVFLSSGKGIEAAECFSELIRRRPESVYAHLKLATVYDELLDEPLMAIMHYQLYLKALPEASDAEEVKAWMQQAEKRYLRSIQPQNHNTSNPTTLQLPNNVELLISCSFPSDLPQEKVTAVTTSLESALKKMPEMLFYSSQQTPEGKYSCLAVYKSGSNADQITERIQTILQTLSPEFPAGVTADSFAFSRPEAAAVANEYEQKIQELQNKLVQYHSRYQFMLYELERLRKIETEYKKRFAANSTAESAATPATTPAANPAVAPTANHPEGARTYTVVAGDTPGKIAYKVYGKSSLYVHILRANPQVNERKLRPGMVLTIPELPNSQ